MEIKIKYNEVNKNFELYINGDHKGTYESMEKAAEAAQSMTILYMHERRNKNGRD